MKSFSLFIIFNFILIVICGCGNRINKGSYGGSVLTSNYPIDSLPPPHATRSVMNFSKVTGWENNQRPVAPKGFTVTQFADSLDHPRWIYVADNGDIFVAESNTILKGFKKLAANISGKLKTQHVGESKNRITLFRDADKNGIYEKRYIFMENLSQPFGMLILGNHFYVGNTDALMQYDYKLDDTAIHTSGKKIVSLPALGS